MAFVREWVFLALLLVLRASAAATVQPMVVTPSTQWYGDDGTWSAVSIRVGTPPQWVDVMVNTVSSETWVVGPAGCKDNNSICTAARGSIYDSSKSSTNKDLGLYSLGVDARLNGSGYADYGFDALEFGSTGVTLNSTIIGSINTTEFFLGMFGVGVVTGSFNGTSSVAAISALVEKNGAIPSNSYGYTAGATYQQKGVPNSLTLGGYDANRFEPHNVTFNLNPSKFPETYINSIYVYSTTPGSNWSTPVQLLSSADRVTAIIDSSTPYLWLPQSVCDSFARTLDLTYNSTLDLYTFDGNASQHDALRNSNMTFTVTLSDTSSAPDTINVVLPYAAFDQQLSFPSIPGTTYGTPAASKYYFPIKRAASTSQYTIGRVFLQEAYIITDYERNTYSVHQAVHTTDPIQNTSIVSINRPSDSTFSSPPGTGSGSRSGSSKNGMAIGAIVGIVVGVVVLITLSAFIIFYFCRRSKRRNTNDDEKPPETSQHRGFLARFRRQPREPPANEAIGSTAYPTEVGADASHARFELAAPLGPAELDSEAGTLSGTTEAGSSTTDSNNMSAYERARRKLERQQVAAGHAQSMQETYPVEKSENDTVQYLSPPDNNSNFSTPMVSPVAVSGTNGSMTASGQPSPVSPHFASHPTSPTSPPPTYRRISPSNVVYAGRLPDNVQLPNVVPRMLNRDGQPAQQEQTLETEPGSSSLGSQYTENQTSGSRDEDIYSAPSTRSAAAYSPVSPPSTASAPTGTGSHSNTNVSDLSGSSQQPLRPFREEDESKFLREDMLALRADMQTREMVDPYKGRTRLGGDEDLVHVPVQAERRFSWEEGGTL